MDFSSHLDGMEGGAGSRARAVTISHTGCPRPQRTAVGSGRALGSQVPADALPPPGAPWPRIEVLAQVGHRLRLDVEEQRAWAAAWWGLGAGPRASGNRDPLLSAGPPGPAGQRLAADGHRHERGMYPRGSGGSRSPQQVSMAPAGVGGRGAGGGGGPKSRVAHREGGAHVGCGAQPAAGHWASLPSTRRVAPPGQAGP